MSTQPMSPSVAKRKGLELYYGFSHEVGYVIRTKSRAYSGQTETVPFTNGQAQVPAVPGANVEQRWNRGERLERMRALGYVIYEMGTEPAPRDEPMWAEQDEPGIDSYETDFGQAYGVRKGYDALAGEANEPEDDED